MKTSHLLLLFTILSFAFWSCSSPATKTENDNEEPETTIEEEFQELVENTLTDTAVVKEPEATQIPEENQGKVIKLDASNFNDFIKGDICVVDFYADWCAPCRAMAPILDKFAQENKNIKVGKINIDNAQQIATKYEIRSVPCFIVLKNGTEVHRMLGSSDFATFSSELQKVIK